VESCLRCASGQPAVLGINAKTVMKKKRVRGKKKGLTVVSADPEKGGEERDSKGCHPPVNSAYSRPSV